MADREPLAADWLAQFGPNDVKPRKSETVILGFDWPDVPAAPREKETGDGTGAC